MEPATTPGAEETAPVRAISTSEAAGTQVAGANTDGRARSSGQVDARQPGRAGAARFMGRVPGWLVAAVIYLGAGVAMWWQVWTGHPTSTMVCGCGDPSSFVWFLAWPAYAISHGHSLFLTTRVHVPAGINLLDNTSVLALGVPLAPVTWLFGPVASLNVALTAAPVTSALAAYGTLRRGLRLGWLAAFLGGLAFGFSPFVLRNDAINHLQASFLALVPLIFWSCYELAVAQRGKWHRWGLLLGVLIVVQYFIGPEMLTVTTFTVGVVLLLASLAALSRKGTLAAKLPFAWRGFLLTGVVASVLLAYPLWFTVAGPEHIRGPDWFYAHANGLGGVLLPIAHGFLQRGWRIDGYEGPLGANEGYLGLPALAVLAAAAVVVRRPLVKLCAAMTIITVWLSLGAVWLPLARGGEPSFLFLPWRAFNQLPVLSKLAPANFSVPAMWFLVVAGALLLDQLLPSRRAVGRAGPRPGSPRAWGARVVAPGMVSAALVIPWLLSWPLPYTTETVTVSSWAARDGVRLPTDSVVLFYPYPATYQDQALIWQADSGMRYALVGGRGIGAFKDGTADHGFAPGTPGGTLSALTTAAVPHYNLKIPPPPSPDTIRSFRGVLRYWGVTNVVMTPGGRDPAYARRWLTAVLGAAPHQQDGAWVWDDVRWLVSR